jgi:hypothetical protein
MESPMEFDEVDEVDEEGVDELDDDLAEDEEDNAPERKRHRSRPCDDARKKGPTPHIGSEHALYQVWEVDAKLPHGGRFVDCDIGWTPGSPKTKGRVIAARFYRLRPEFING